MKKQFILNLLLNLGIFFLIMSGYAAYQSGNMLVLGLSIAISVVLVYLKIVLLKHVRRTIGTQKQETISKTKKK